jgi:hypothetical protein
LEVDEHACLLELTAQPLVLAAELHVLGGERIADATAFARCAENKRACIALPTERFQVRGIQAFASQDRSDLSEGRRVTLGEDRELVFGAEATSLRSLWNLGIAHA